MLVIMMKVIMASLLLTYYTYKSLLFLCLKDFKILKQDSWQTS